MNLAERWAALMRGLRQESRYRVLRLPGEVDFTSNDYLGYASRKFRSESSSPGDENLSGTASRLLRGHRAIWDEVETALADWHGAAAGLVMTSGYVANEGLLSTVVEADDWIASDAFNHASIIDGLRLARAEKFVFRHNDLGHLEDGLASASRPRLPRRQLFIVTESLFGMEGDLAPLVDIVALAEKHGAHVIVDEAHATGCFGPTGSGCVDQLGLRQRVLATVHTGGKALGVLGAYVCGSHALKELLINRCRHFIFTTALPPIAGTWWLRALARVRADEPGRAALHRNAAFFRAALSQHGLQAGGRHYVVPVVVGADADALRAAEELRADGWDMRAIRPPTVPAGTARLRIAIHAEHEPAMLQTAAAAVARALGRGTT